MHAEQAAQQLGIVEHNGAPVTPLARFEAKLKGQGGHDAPMDATVMGRALGQVTDDVCGLLGVEDRAAAIDRSKKKKKRSDLRMCVQVASQYSAHVVGGGDGCGPTVVGAAALFSMEWVINDICDGSLMTRDEQSRAWVRQALGDEGPEARAAALMLPAVEDCGGASAPDLPAAAGVAAAEQQQQQRSRIRANSNEWVVDARADCGLPMKLRRLMAVASAGVALSLQLVSDIVTSAQPRQEAAAQRLHAKVKQEQQMWTRSMVGKVESKTWEGEVTLSAYLEERMINVGVDHVLWLTHLGDCLRGDVKQETLDFWCQVLPGSDSRNNNNNNNDNMGGGGIAGRNGGSRIVADEADAAAARRADLRAELREAHRLASLACILVNDIGSFHRDLFRDFTPNAITFVAQAHEEEEGGGAAPIDLSVPASRQTVDPSADPALPLDNDAAVRGLRTVLANLWQVDRKLDQVLARLPSRVARSIRGLVDGNYDFTRTCARYDRDLERAARLLAEEEE